MGDRFGRSIRYEGTIPDLDLLLADQSEDEREGTRAMVEALVGAGLALAEIIDGLEGLDGLVGGPSTSGHGSRRRRSWGAGDNIEVVVIDAHSREDLLRTHARYFLSLEELAERMTRRA